jgi:hypothetical protein
MARWLARQQAETLERFAQPTRSFLRHNTMPGDFAVADAARLVAEIFDDFCMVWLGAPQLDSS